MKWHVRFSRTAITYFTNSETTQAEFFKVFNKWNKLYHNKNANTNKNTGMIIVFHAKMAVNCSLKFQDPFFTILFLFIANS